MASSEKDQGGTGKPKLKSSGVKVTREAVCELLAATPFMEASDPLFWHGRAFGFDKKARSPPPPPTCTWKSKEKPRDDHDTDAWLTASEFSDTPDVVVRKCQQLAQLMQLSRKTVLYTGAGISASVIGQAARSGTNTVGWKNTNKRTVPPTFTHRALGYLGRRGLVHGWVQQNHDGLPQKAGFPQENLNEVHGSWYDPSNPVVKYSGDLHDRAYPWMVSDAETADLVIVLGTSLGGLNADQVATNAAERSLVSGGALGTVCLNLQQTPQDLIMTLRLFGKTDQILKILLKELGLTNTEISEVGKPPKGGQLWPVESRVLVPYDKNGLLLPGKGGGGGGGGEDDVNTTNTTSSSPSKGDRKWMWLDLSEGQGIRLTEGHNIQGAKQPMYMHIGSKKDRKLKNGKLLKAGPGNGSVVRRDEAECAFKLQIEGATMSLGIWWLEAARRGAVPQLPLVNRSPVFCSVDDDGKPTKGKGNAPKKVLN